MEGGVRRSVRELAELEEDKLEVSFLQKVLVATSLNTCFCFKKTVKGTPPGEKPKIIALDTRGVLENTGLSKISVNGDGDDSIEVDRTRVRVTNQVTTSKYTIWDFFFRATGMQFKRFVNAFYLFTAIISLIGVFVVINDGEELFLVPYNPITVILLLVVVVVVTLIFESYADLKRHNADKRTNGKPAVRVTEEGHLVTTKWKHLKPGDVIKIDNRQEVPADVLVLKSDLAGGICYIETSGIDGETNLKIKEVPEKFRAALKEEMGESNRNSFKEENEIGKDGEVRQRVESSIVSPRKLAIYKAVVKISRGIFYYEEPNSFLQFSGKFVSEKGDIPLDFSNILLRGSELRNTSWVLGMVMYAGMETKLVLSKKATPVKFSLLDKFVNKMIIFDFFALLFVCIFLTFLLTTVLQNAEATDTESFWYFGNVDLIDAFTLPPFIAYFLTFIILFSGFVPITVYVALEVSLAFAAYFIASDEEMYDEVTESYSECRTNTLASDIGQITHIVSDKTGTLTNNVMTLVSIFVQNTLQSYGEAAVDEDQERSKLDRGDINTLKGLKEQLKYFYDHFDAESDEKKEEVKALMEWLELVCLCHSVLIDFDEDGEIRYNAEGPDEEALVVGAKRLGFVLVESGRNSMTLENEFTNERSEFEVLALNPFSSKRKRMSIVVARRDDPERVFLLMKGADNVMTNLAEEPKDGAQRKALDDQILKYAWAGLRTLVMGKKEMSREEFNAWKEDYDKAAAIPGNERMLALEEVADAIESGVELIGASAIEDELQKGVPETIQKLRDANIKLWVATGDKVETAINISLSAKLLDPEMLQVLLTSKKQDELLKSIEEGLDLIENAAKEKADDEKKDSKVSIEAESVALIVSGAALEQLLKAEKGNAVTEEQFSKLANVCKVVVACRVSPKQKALIVDMISDKEHGRGFSFGRLWSDLCRAKTNLLSFQFLKPATRKNLVLAIGDGANDVAMIQHAAVGVGINGKEGRQAVNNSDFAIPQFRFLQKLLLVHGTWNYVRNTRLVKYVTYSWLFLSVTLVSFQAYSLVSGQLILVNPLYQTLFGYIANLFCVFVAATDRFLTKETLLQNPWIYLIGQNCLFLNGRESFLHVSRAIFHGILVFFLVMFLFDSAGNSGLINFGAVLYAAIVLVVTQRQIAIASTFTFIHVVLMSILMLIFLVAMFALDSPAFLYFGINSSEEAVSDHFQVAFFCAAVVGFSELFMKYVKVEFFPSAFDILVESDRGFATNKKFIDVVKLHSGLTPRKLPKKVVLDQWKSTRSVIPGEDEFKPQKIEPKFNYALPSSQIEETEEEPEVEEAAQPAHTEAHLRLSKQMDLTL